MNKIGLISLCLLAGCGDGSARLISLSFILKPAPENSLPNTFDQSLVALSSGSVLVDNEMKSVSVYAEKLPPPPLGYDFVVRFGLAPNTFAGIDEVLDDLEMTSSYPLSVDASGGFGAMLHDSEGGPTCKHIRAASVLLADDETSSVVLDGALGGTEES